MSLFPGYSKHQIPLNEKPQNDAYFIGGLKGGRTKLINDTYKYLTKKGIKCDFKTMLYKPISNQDIVSGINYITNGWISYENVLKDISNSKCLIEILQQEQHGPSLRYFESVCYNKKLLTNNPLIKDYPYYNPLYMKIFNDINDIDIDWLQQEVMIDYEYKDEFSPLNLIKYINALVSR